MTPFDQIAERKIVAAIERGELSHLPGEGAPLELDDDTLIPDELRMAFRILRNAGLIPPEVETLKAIGDLETCIAQMPNDERRIRALRRLQLLQLRLSERRGSRCMPGAASLYGQKMLNRLGQDSSDAV